MRRLTTISFILTICLLLILTVIPAATPVFAQGETTVYTKINSSFSVGNNYSYASSTIPSNSTIYHRENGVTEFYGPNQKLLLAVKDFEASQVPTPHGMLPATRVQEVPDGAYVDCQENVTKVYSNPDKKNCILTIIDQTDSSNTQSLTQSSNVQSTTPTVTGWVEDTNTLSKPFSNLTTFTAYWKVPTSPKNKGNVVNFVFNGIQPDGGTIIQPVLEWNNGGSGRWTVSSWYVYPGGSIRSYPLNVNVGNTIWGTMTYLPTGNCWQIAIFTNNKANSSRQLSINGSRIFRSTSNLSVFCTLEAYNIQSNNDICGKIEFYNMICKSNTSNNLNIPWRT